MRISDCGMRILKKQISDSAGFINPQSASRIPQYNRAG
jgi:hypothetical protein